MWIVYLCRHECAVMDSGCENLLCIYSLNSIRQKMIYHSGNPVIGPPLQTKQVCTCLLKHSPRGWIEFTFSVRPSFYKHIKLNILHREKKKSVFWLAFSSFLFFHVTHSAADWPQVEWGSIWCVGKDRMRRSEKISGRKLMEKQDEEMGICECVQEEICVAWMGFERSIKYAYIRITCDEIYSNRVGIYHARVISSW